MLFTFNPLLAALAALALVGALVAGGMGALLLSVLRPPSTTRARLWRHLLRLLLSCVVLGGLVVGLVGLYVAL